MLLIWWTSQAECEQIGDALSESVPDYIRSEYRSRLGRNGRGRLWVASRIALDEIPWDATKPAARLASDRAGIVVDATDVEHVFGLPGFLTDTSLNFVNVWPDAALCEQIAALTAERDAAQTQVNDLRRDYDVASICYRGDIERLAAECNALRLQLAALIAERDELCAQLAAEKAAYQEMLQHFERLDEDREAELAAAQEWQPVGTSEYIECSDGSLETSDESTGYYLVVTGPGGDLIHRTVAVKLPPDLRLCRRTRQEPPA